MKTIVNLLVLFLLTIQFANATDYYVSPSGDNSKDGQSTGNAWQTLTYADASVSANDVVYVMNGTYDQFVIKKSGSASLGYITYKAYPGHNPKVTVNIATAGDFESVKIIASYIVWDGIEVIGLNQSTGLQLAVSNYNNIVDAGGLNAPQSEFIKTINTNINGISIGNKKDPIITNITVKNCYVHECAGGGISSENSDNVVIENNIVYNNCWYTMWATSGISVKDLNGGGVITIRGNRVYNNYCLVKWIEKEEYSDGNGIIIDVNTGYNGYFTVENNLVYDNGGRGLYVLSAKNATFRNNTSYWNSKSSFSTGGEMVVYNSTNVAFINNIAWANPEYSANNYALKDGYLDYTSNSNITWQNNITYNGTNGDNSVKLYNTTTTYIDNSNKLGVNPLLVNPGISGGDFHPNPGSLAINAGTSVYGVYWYDLDYNDRVQGGAIDIGCYESSSAQKISKTAGSVEAVSVAHLSIYPNPVLHGTVTLKLTGFNQEKVQLTIFDTQGRLIVNKSLFNQNNIQISTINTLKTGVYSVKVQSRNSTVVQKLLVK
jgi:hypothetical protein